MKILSVIAQKPDSTGSGIYLRELVRHFKEMGHEQEVICANGGDEAFYHGLPFDTEELPMKIVGMSDVMPYDTIKYSDLAKDEKLLHMWEQAFRNKIIEVADRFKPDLIICHHLYLLTSIVLELCSSMDAKIFGICHNTDLRQYQKTDLKRDFIKSNLKKLDRVFAPSEEHKKKIVELFGIEEDKIQVIGIGYNSEIFFNANERHNSNKKKLLYVGKIAKKKGVLSLVKAFNKIERSDLELELVGGAGDANEYEEILKEIKKAKNRITVLPAKTQKELAKEYNSHDIFILPSFSEGIPIVPIEAMACGCRLVITDLPGVKDFYKSNVRNASIKYVSLPNMTNVDDVEQAELAAFEDRLSSTIIESVEDKNSYEPMLSDISWKRIAEKVGAF